MKRPTFIVALLVAFSVIDAAPVAAPSPVAEPVPAPSPVGTHSITMEIVADV